MTHISRKKLDPEVNKYVLESLTFILKETNTKEEVEKFLSSAISETERLMIAKRVAAAFLLRHNIESEKISETLKLTPATVARLKLWVQTHQEGFDLVFNKLEKQRRKQMAKAILYKLLNYAINAAFGRSPKPPFPKPY